MNVRAPARPPEFSPRAWLLAWLGPILVSCARCRCLVVWRDGRPHDPPDAWLRPLRRLLGRWQVRQQGVSLGDGGPHFCLPPEPLELGWECCCGGWVLGPSCPHCRGEGGGG